MLPLLLLSLLVLLGSAAAQTTTCVNAGYDISAITGSDLFYLGSSSPGGTVYTWAIRPCGRVSTAGYCTGNAGTGGQFCQGTTIVSTYAFANVSSGVVAASSPLWGQVYLQGQYGVAQVLDDGDSCGGSVGDREGTIAYLCNPAATTPYISSITELATCQYEAIIQTSVVCPQVPSTGISQTPGTLTIDTACGGGIYDLTSISNADIIGYSNGNSWAIRPCGVLSSRNCSDTTTSVCQFGAGYGYSVARYNPVLQIALWQYGGPGVLSEIQQSGDEACTNQHRFSNITYICNATATTPVFTLAVESPSCHYFLTVQTSAVCGSAFATPLPTYQPPSSSTGAAVAPTLTPCAFAGYDLTSITGQDILIGSNGGGGTAYVWGIRPCGVVTTPGLCQGEFCQAGTIISYQNYSTRSVSAGYVWGQVSMNGQYGVAQFLQDGDSCGTSVGDRAGTINYLCNATATTPFISSVSESITCHYVAVVQTAAICSQVPSTGVSQAPGTPIVSTQCGGGIYDLTSINNADITGFVSSTNTTWSVRPCGSLAITNCSAGTSVCQYGPGYGFTAGIYQPTLIASFYEYLAPGVVSQIYRDGAACGNQQRFVNITYVCNSAATTPVFVPNVVESPTCNYYITIQTAATCGTAFASSGGGGGGSGALATANICFLTYALTGTPEYPWSIAYSVNVQYYTTPVNGPNGQAYQIASGSGVRTYTNNVGTATSVQVTLGAASSTADNLVYTNGAFDSLGLVFTPASAVQQPGEGPSPLASTLYLRNVSGLREAGAYNSDPRGVAFLANFPGFASNITIGASNLNALAPNYATCSAPITFTNGLRTPVQPNANNGAQRFRYSYTISDGSLFTVFANLSIVCDTAFANAQDSLGNNYQNVLSITGTRTYTYIPTGAQVVSTVTGITSPPSQSQPGFDQTPSQRFYPYALLISAPGVYTTNTAPFIDGDGLEYNISPAAPVNGVAPGTANFRTTIQVFTNAFQTLGQSWLTEDFDSDAPLIQYQQQTYLLN